jgi:hypothetical protein
MAFRKIILKFIFSQIILYQFNTVSAQYYFDSIYIKKYYNNALWSLYQNYNNHSLFISQKFHSDSTINTALNPIAESLVNVGFAYSNEKRFIAINLYSVPYQPSKRKPQPMAVNFIIGNNIDNKVSELGVNWFSGYYEKNSANFVPNFNDSASYYSYNRLNTTNVFYNYINFSNKRKFSYGAAYIMSGAIVRISGIFVSCANWISFKHIIFLLYLGDHKLLNLILRQFLFSF